MKKRKLNVNVMIGTSTIFMTFVILIMTIIALLTFNHSNSYYQSTNKQITRTKEYYIAQTKGLDYYYKYKENKNLKEVFRNQDYKLYNNIIQYSIKMNDHSSIKFEINTNDMSIKYNQETKEVQ